MSDPITTKAEKPAPAAKGGRNFGRRGKQSVKLLGVLRGAGSLQDGRRKTAVTYQIDVYGGGPYVNGAGVLYGAIRPTKREDGAPMAILTLEDGGAVSVLITGVDEDGVDIETRGAIPGYEP